MNLDEAIEQMRQMTADSTCDINNEKDIGQYHAELTAILAAMEQARRELETATGALADIGTSADMTLELARNKANRIYDAITASKGGA